MDIVSLSTILTQKVIVSDDPTVFIVWRRTSDGGLRVFGEGRSCATLEGSGSLSPAPPLGTPVTASGVTWNALRGTLSVSTSTTWAPCMTPRGEALLMDYIAAITFSSELTEEDAGATLRAWREGEAMPETYRKAVDSIPPVVFLPARPLLRSQGHPTLLDAHVMHSLAPGFTGLSIVYVVQVETDTCGAAVYSSFPHQRGDRTCSCKVTRDESGALFCGSCGRIEDGMASEVRMWKCPLLLSKAPQGPERLPDECVRAVAFEDAGMQILGCSGEEFHRSPTLRKLAILTSVEEMRVHIEWVVTNSNRRGVHEREVIIRRAFTAT